MTEIALWLVALVLVSMAFGFGLGYIAGSVRHEDEPTGASEKEGT